MKPIPCVLILAPSLPLFLSSSQLRLVSASGFKSSEGSTTFAPGSREVSLLFENDGNWEALANHSSALLFHAPETFSDAQTICTEVDEQLFKKEMVHEISNELSYLQFLGQFSATEEFWIDGGVISGSGSSSNDSTISETSDKKLPFLCTNSAPLTSKVDTDFSVLPKMNVSSEGTVFTGTRDHLTFRFTGIPYALPPTGSRRFQVPEVWTGENVVNATGFKPGCLQFGSFANNDAGLNPWGIDEDCLYLNVYTSYIPSSSFNKTDNADNLASASNSSPSSLRPVILWIHGGANINGVGSDATFDGGPLVSRGDVVLVTINYRLNIFGFLGVGSNVSFNSTLSSSPNSTSDSSKTTGNILTGNYALADKILALTWVQEHISAFGGDPDRVTIMGQSAGGWSIVDLIRTPKAKSEDGKTLFQGAISMSGGDGTIITGEAQRELVLPFLAPLCNANDSTSQMDINIDLEFLQCLQDLPADTLLNVTNFLSITAWSSVLDGVYVVNSSLNQVMEGPEGVNDIKFMLGFMPEEGQSLMGTAVSPNATDFNQSLVAIEGSTLAEAVLESGLWEISEDFDVYNATQSVLTDAFLSCGGDALITAAAESGAFPAMYVYIMQHAYGLSFFDPFELCTFPVGMPRPYYRCHSGDLYEIFGTYYIFDQPIRIPTDISYTNLAQDLWSSFARTGNPNPDKEDLRARGPAYASTLSILEETGWVWETYVDEDGEDGEDGMIASLDYPELGTTRALPDKQNGRCAVIDQVQG